MRHHPGYFLILGLAALLTACGPEEPQSEEQALTKTINVEAKTIASQPFERYIKLVGTVESEHDVQLSAEVSGRIERYYVQKGDRIAAGAPILKIDDSKLQRQQSQLKAQVEQAREQYERLQRVFEQDSIGAEIDVINAKANFEERRAALESVEVDLQNTTVRAPFAAVLDEKMLETGEMTSPGTRLVRLIGSDNLKVVTGVPSRFSDAIQKGDQSRIWFDFQTADTLQLPISYVGQSINQDARTFTVEIDLPPRRGTIKVDMNANVRIRTFRRDSSVVIGEEYTYQQGSETVVYTIQETANGRKIAHRQPIVTGASYENSVLVEQGLHPGDRLITVGSSFLQDSMNVAVVNRREQQLSD